MRNGDTNSEGEFELTNEVYVFEVSTNEKLVVSAGFLHSSCFSKKHYINEQYVLVCGLTALLLQN